LFTREKADQEFECEIEEHLQLLSERFRRQGMSPEDAKNAARRQFGGVTQLQEYHRDTRGIPWIEHFLRDLVLSMRLLRKRLGFSLATVTVLALGIGANTAVYSVARAVIFAPLPFPNPDRVVQLWQAYKDGKYEPGGENVLNIMSVRNGLFTDWREHARCLESMAATQKRQMILMGDKATSVVDGFLVGDGFFETLGVVARLGRQFTASDYAAEGAPIVVLADQMWRAQYNADPSILGRDIVLDGKSYRVVGVMPPGFLPTRGERDPQFFIPMRWDPATKYNRELWGNFVYCRLKPGVALQQAQAEMDRVDAQLWTLHPNDEARAVVVPLDGYLFGHHERMFVLLLAAVGLVLLIACANVANLLLARALERQREFAVRAALGASRAAILRQVLIESLVIAGAGGLAGLALSPLLTRPALALLPTSSKIPRLDQVQLDPVVLLFTLIISLGCGFLFGVVPAIRAGRGDLSAALNSRGRGTSVAKREGRLSDALVVAEVALSLVLLVGGGLLTRAFLKLLHSDPGFRPAQSLALELSIPAYRYAQRSDRGWVPDDSGGSQEGAARQALYDRLKQAVQSLASVEAAGVSGKLPLRQFWDGESFGVDGRPPLTTREGPPWINKRTGRPLHGDASIQSVSPGYFRALGIPLLRGRLFDDHTECPSCIDRSESSRPVVINEAVVHKFFPTEDPIGKRIWKGGVTPVTIVGVVRDSRLDGMDREVLPEVFTPMDKLWVPNVWLIVRTRDSTDSVAAALRQIIRDIDPEVGIVESSAMTKVVGDSLWRERFSALLVGLFAILAVLIAAGGLYAVISQAVQRRTHELGVRVALGASGAQIAKAVLAQGLRVTSIGLALGTLITIAAGRILARQIQLASDQFQRNDGQAYQFGDVPWLLAVVASMLIVLTLLACWFPVRRALAVDPVTTLRSE
jgi:putative ABC transport system permease protein